MGRTTSKNKVGPHVVRLEKILVSSFIGVCNRYRCLAASHARLCRAVQLCTGTHCYHHWTIHGASELLSYELYVVVFLKNFMLVASNHINFKFSVRGNVNKCIVVPVIGKTEVSPLTLLKNKALLLVWIKHWLDRTVGAYVSPLALARQVFLRSAKFPILDGEEEELVNPGTYGSR